MCIYISVNTVIFFLFSLNPLMRKSETVAFIIVSLHDKL